MDVDLRYEVEKARDVEGSGKDEREREGGVDRWHRGGTSASEPRLGLSLACCHGPSGVARRRSGGKSRRRGGAWIRSALSPPPTSPATPCTVNDSSIHPPRQHANHPHPALALFGVLSASKLMRVCWRTQRVWGGGISLWELLRRWERAVRAQRTSLSAERAACALPSLSSSLSFDGCYAKLRSSYRRLHRFTPSCTLATATRLGLFPSLSLFFLLSLLLDPVCTSPALPPSQC